MGRSYSKDLRTRVIECLKEGEKYEEVSRKFRVSLAAIGKWYKRYKEEGNCEAKNRGGSKRKINLEELTRYVEKNPQMTLKEGAKEFQTSIFTISYWLRRMGYSYKKKPLAMWRRIKRSEMSTTNI